MLASALPLESYLPSQKACSPVLAWLLPGATGADFQVLRMEGGGRYGEQLESSSSALTLEAKAR
jgi:hypothetical protein